MFQLDTSNPSTDLLVKVRASGVQAFSNRAMGLTGGSAPEAILELPAGSRSTGMGLDASSEAATWFRLGGNGAASAWDRAHALLGQGFAATGAVLAAEPDVAQVWTADPAAAGPPPPDPLPQTDGGGRAMDLADGFAWHLLEQFGGLGVARAQVSAADQAKVLIAHLDTGYDRKNAALPRGLQTDLQRNFTKEGDPKSAADVTPTGGLPLTRNRGHGGATVSLLAGGDVGQREKFSGDLGGAPDARVLPIRIADSVVRFTTSTMVQGIDWAIQNGAHVLSMSMGGLASRALADAVNRAYEAGLVMVTAAGNNIWPSFASVVYPARFRRVVAATGVMADGRAYAGLAHGTMQGNYGPGSKMDTAVAGFSPNIPWARFGSGHIFELNGQGTSCATPQVAAAAALWIAKHWDDLEKLPEKWMRVEAVRRALFDTAQTQTAKMGADETRQKLGRGVVRAAEALKHPVDAVGLTRTPVADASWDWLKVLTGIGVGLAQDDGRAAMLQLELMQLAQDDEIAASLADHDPDVGVGAQAQEAFRASVLQSGKGSQLLRRTLAATARVGSASNAPAGSPQAPVGAELPAGVPPVVTAPTARTPGVRQARKDPTPAKRRLRVYALDPSLGASLDWVDLNIATVSVPYEVDRRGDSILRPGPVGEYLEVVDIDPASDRVYEPVDLDRPALLVSDGLDPSEGNPRFHQQMVYAIGMKTIGAFEEALGRKALWAPHHDSSGLKPGDGYVQRLRIYPHALRDRNAYYSPSKVALLFGYFPAEVERGDAIAGGSLVFACLSADIVSHEMTHALLDGLYRRYEEQSNPDVGAFHEGFADIVALFQHFTYTDIVASAIGKARGEIGAARMLSGLARQFGQGSGRKGPLRDYLDPDIGKLTYPETTEVHARGSILVAAIYEAFIAIVEKRIGDLIRLATGGSGVLPAGDLHPGLITRLAHETCKAASQVQRMCIRALDYCPPVDITFGEYLRALMTADLEQVPEDRLGYRTAIMQAFREKNLLPANLRTVSVETLVWRRPGDAEEGEGRGPAWLRRAVEDLGIDWGIDRERHQIFKLTQTRCWKFWEHLNRAFQAGEAHPCEFGLQDALPPYGEDFSAHTLRDGVRTNFEVHTVRRVRRVRPNGGIAQEIVVILAQRRPEWIDPADPGQGRFWFRGGATLIIDPFDPVFRYIITKDMGAAGRLARQRETEGGPIGGTTRARYFDTEAMARAEPFAMLHAEYLDSEADA